MRRMLVLLGAWWALTRWTERWGALPSEGERGFPGDELVRDPQLDAIRAVVLDAPPEDVFPWLVQMGVGRAGWYSFDLLDNGGRPSAERIHLEWQDAGEGDSLGEMAGIEFLVRRRHDPDVFVISLPPSGPIAFTLAYRLHRWGRGTRLVARVRAAGPWWAGPLLRFLLGPADFVMMRRQFAGLARRLASRTT